MDGGAAIATIEVLVQNLINVSKEEISLIRGLQKNADKLRETLGMMQSFMDDAQNKFITDDSVKRWLKQLEEASFEADNVLDELNYQFLSNKMKKSIQTAEKKKIPSCFPSFNQYARRRRMALRVRGIDATFESINNQATKLGLESRLANAPAILDAGSEETDSITVDPIFIGRDNAVSEIVGKLTEGSTEKVFSILPIVGMGGLGKTTLTKKVFNHDKIKTHFGKHIWVHVSKIFDPVILLKKTLASLTSEDAEVGSREVLLKKLREALREKTYLLVLDDVWSRDPQKWKGFIDSLLGISSMKGNGIIVTTRNIEVASIVKTIDIHYLNGLSEEDCWSIIKEKAFGGGDVPPGFKNIGRDIARRCQGLPLAANVVGGVLHGKSEDKWCSIKENWLSDVEDGENNISNILKLSYDHLSSPSLKKCFAYCSIYPKGGEMDKQELIELWMAEGFLQPDHTSDMETVGNKFLNLLLQNSLLQVAKRDKYDNTTHCSMHDLVHDLAYSVLRSDYYGHESGEISKENAKCLRTLFYEGEISDIIFSEFKSLHVLTLSNEDVEELPSSIKELTHLRYLNITDTRINSLPDSIGQLYHLQTLRAKPEVLYLGTEPLKMPYTLKYLISLRHLHITNDTELPAEVGMLTSLQTLKHFKVGEEKGHRIEELGSLQNLKGKLKIHNLEKVDGEAEAKNACLFKKPKIIKLVLEWDESREENIQINDENVLKGLQPHPNLKMLKIMGFKGTRFPSWTSEMLGFKYLMEIKLSSCSECEEIPMMGHLPHLKGLFLFDLMNVKCIGASFYGIDSLYSSNNGVGKEAITVFPALKRMSLSYMPHLREWAKVEVPYAGEPREVKVFPSLEYLSIDRCPKLVSAPRHEFQCLKELDISECDNLVSLPYLSLCNNQNLSKLSISYCPKLALVETCGIKLTSLTCILICNLEGLIRLPNWLFIYSPNLRRLQISECPELRELPDGLHTLTSLEELTIEKCPYLEYLDTGLALADTCGIKLTFLKKIQIQGLEGLVCLPNWLFSNSPNLKRLEICYCSKLRELPDGLHTLTSLENLTIRQCPNLKSIPCNSSSSGRGVLTSLQKFSIERCGSLVNLPCEMVESCAPYVREFSLWYLESLMNLPMILDCLHEMQNLIRLTVVGVPKLIMNNSCTLRSLQELTLGPDASDSMDSFNSGVDGILKAASQSSWLVDLDLRGKDDWDLGVSAGSDSTPHCSYNFKNR